MTSPALTRREFLNLLATRGLCRDMDPDLWFPEFDERTTEYADQAKQAVAICNVCPVKDECLAYGLKHEDYGIWGGTTPSQRREMRKNESPD